MPLELPWIFAFHWYYGRSWLWSWIPLLFFVWRSGKPGTRRERIIPLGVAFLYTTDVCAVQVHELFQLCFLVRYPMVILGSPLASFSCPLAPRDELKVPPPYVDAHKWGLSPPFFQDCTNYLILALKIWTTGRRRVSPKNIPTVGIWCVSHFLQIRPILKYFNRPSYFQVSEFPHSI